jgi:TfoX/Sxy family transcriptional regulator of competence genes
MSPAKRPPMPKIPKPDEETKALFESVVPDHPNVTTRPMFGNVSAFVHGNMFMGLFGRDLFLRLSDEDRDAVTAAGGGPFEPMPGRPMRDYVLVPGAWLEQPARLREWADRSLEWAEALPPKERKPAKGPRKRS